jgi:cytochrome d ubiquinol oxidase subunit I
MALFTLIGYMVVYAAVFTGGIYYVIRIVREGAEPVDAMHAPAHAKRPLSAAETSIDDAAASGARS